jgi:hypothetical protein
MLVPLAGVPALAGHANPAGRRLLLTRLAGLELGSGSSGARTSGRRASMGRTSGVTWLLTNIPESAVEIPITAPVWALLQCHHPNAMPAAMKA